MKKLNIFYILLLVFGLPGCYDDLGNYDYREINEIEVDSIRSLYEVDVDDSLCINPIIRGTQYSDTSRFTYEWEIANKIVDSTHNLNIVVNMSPGNKVCRYIVKDKETSVQRYYQFRLNVRRLTIIRSVMERIWARNLNNCCLAMQSLQWLILFHVGWDV